MNKLLSAAMISLPLLACNDSKKEVGPDPSSIDPSKLASPIHYVNWELGNFDNLVTVTRLYKMWDGKDSVDVASYFADTLHLRLLDAKEEINIPNNQVSKRLAQNRKMYTNTSNEMVSGVSLRDKTSGEEWVMITAYAKWTEKNGTKDSILYHDDWRLKDGKVDLLISFAKQPQSMTLDK